MRRRTSEAQVEDVKESTPPKALNRDQRWKQIRLVCDAIVREFRKLPILDDRHPDEIIGYDEHGLPT